MSFDVARLGGITLPSDGEDTLGFVPSRYFSILGAAIDSLVTVFAQGLAAARPASGTPGRLYLATDTGLLSWDTGSAWVALNASAAADPAAHVPGLRTLGSGALQAAAGTHSHASTALTDWDAVQLAAAWSVPGVEVQGLTSTITAVSSGATSTVVAAPTTGTRVVKSMLLAGPANSVATVTLGGLTVARLPFSMAGVAQLATVLPLVAGDALQVTASGGAVTCIAAWGDRADATLSRLALKAPSGAGTLVSAGTARTISQIWVCNPSTTNAITCTLLIGETMILPAALIPVSGLLVIDGPLQLTAAQALMHSGSGMTLMVTGR